MRVFFCLPIDPASEDRLHHLATQLRHDTRTPASWVAPGNYHVTVRFLGEIEPELCTPLHDLAREVARSTPRHVVTLDRLSAFPGRQRPRVVWAGGAAPAPFRSLLDALDKGLERMGFPPGRKDALVHITLARIKGRPDEALRRGLVDLGTAAWQLPAERLILMESHLGRRGARYDPLFSVPLAGDDGPREPRA
jgi:2'-5' RNA ligase